MKFTVQTEPRYSPNYHWADSPTIFSLEGYRGDFDADLEEFSPLLVAANDQWSSDRMKMEIRKEISSSSERYNITRDGLIMHTTTHEPKETLYVEIAFKHAEDVVQFKFQYC